MKILLAEDEEFIAEELSKTLLRNGYTVDVEHDGANIPIAIAIDSYDLLIMDLDLPNLSGLEIIRRIRSAKQALPILILTKDDNLQNRIEAFNSGANDCLIRPVEVAELEARIRALLRKDIWSNRTEIRLGKLLFNTGDYTVSVDGKNFSLTAQELAVLQILLQKPGFSIRKKQILTLLSDWNHEVTDNALGITVFRLRKKLEEAHITIKTTRGIGYSLEELKP